MTVELLKHGWKRLTRLFEPPPEPSEAELARDFQLQFGVRPGDPEAKEIVGRQLQVLSFAARNSAILDTGIGFNTSVAPSIQAFIRSNAIAVHFGYLADISQEDPKSQP